MSTYRIFRKSNRHSLDITRDILLVASVKVRKTRIMYQANLSFVQVKKYLHALLMKELLRRDGDSCYLITNKGLKFLELYDQYLDKCKAIREQVDKSTKERVLLENMCTCHEHSEEQTLSKTS